MPDTTGLLSFLRTVPLLSGLDSPAFGRVAAACRTRQLPRGCVVFSRGEPAEALYIVRSGQIAEFAGGPGEVEIFIKERRPGDFFGEMGILIDEPELVTTMTTQDSVLLVMYRDVFLQLVRTEPSVTFFLLKTMVRRMKASGERLAAQSLLEAPARLAYMVLRLEQEEGGRGTVSFTQDYLAQRCGLARQTAARVLGEWRRQGWIITHRGWIEVADRAALSRVLEAISGA